MTRVCYECGQELSESANTCTLCGATLLIQLPGFSERYEAMEFLHSGKQSDAFVVRRKSDGEYFLAKFYSRPSDAEDVEESILTQLDHPAIPKIVDSIKAEGRVCIVREYARGASLDRLSYMLDEDGVLDIGLQLCDILIYLHCLEPPVIHRDIKPQNVILDDEGFVHLIDFGISRKFSNEALKDTASIGTEGFMPPEQYGFKQTDCRADIYSMGVLLCWLLSGQRDAEKLTAPVSAVLIEIIKKSTAFAPENRYPSANAVKEALLQM